MPFGIMDRLRARYAHLMANDSRSSFCGAAVIATALVLSAPALADSGAPKWTPWVELGGRISNDRALGESILFAPLMQSHRALLFADLRGMFDDSDAREGNFGIGLRYMLPSGWNVGAFGYFDVRRSALGNSFHQATFGFEALSRDFDVRANAYLPVGDREKRIDLSSSSSTIVGAPGLVLTGTTLAIQTDTITTTTTSFLAERALAGFDAEVGIRLPVFDLESALDLRAYAGGYYFDAAGFDEVAGPRGRLELTARDLGGYQGLQLTAGVTFQHDNVRDEQVIGHARLRIPLQRETARQPERLTYMERRMMDTVIRDVDIVSNSATGSATSTSATTVSESVINTWNDEMVTSVTFVAGNDGQAAVQNELDSQGAGSVVVLNGALNAPAGVLVTAAQTLIGGGTTLRVRGENSGLEFDYVADGAAGSITGAGTAPPLSFRALVTLGTGSVVGGLALQQMGTVNPHSVVLAENADNAVVFGNTITGANYNYAHGIAARFSQNVLISGNTIITGPNMNSFGIILGDGASGVAIGNDITTNHSEAASIMLSGLGSVRFADNTLRAPADGRIIWMEGGTFLSGSTGNEIVGPYGTLCRVFSPGSGTVSFTDGSSCSF